MKSSAKNISLTSLDDLFSTEEERSKDVVGTVVNIPLSQLHDFPDHPFKVRDDEKMEETVESVKSYGVLVPAIVRQRPDGEYEIVSGHRRKRASELAGLSELPAIVRDLDDDAATIIMVDSNLQRENILPSERAAAYKMKLEAIKRQGERRDLTSAQVGQKIKWAVERVAEDAGESRSQVQRYVRLTELQPELQEMVDTGKIAMTPAVEISYIHSEKDILKLVTALIANTKGEGKAGDDFWVKAETLLYTALIGYIHYEAPVEEQNFSTLIEFINAMEVREDDEEFQNPVDIMFEELAKNKPGHFAVRQYAKNKLVAGKTAKNILISCGARLAPFDIQELRDLTAYDELQLDTLGDKETALFIIMSDTDDIGRATAI